MPENHPVPLTCPTCGAALDYDGKNAIARCKYCRNACVVPGALPGQEAVSRPALDEVRRLAAGGDPVGAIRRYREAYGVGLNEARQAVEALQAGRLAEPSELARAPLIPVESGEVVEEIRDLLNAGNKLDAIRRYREIYDVSMARARYAVEQVEAGRTIWPEAGFAAASPVVSPTAQPPGAKGRAGCIFTLALLFLIGGILALVLFLPGGPFTPLLVATGPAILLPSGPGAPPDLAAAFYAIDDETYLLGRVAGDSGRILWRTDALPGSDPARGLASNAGLVFVAGGAELLAFRQDDGSLAWQAHMPDSLNYGETNLLAVDGRVIAANLDQSIQAYDTAGGLAWSRRLAGYDRNLRLVDGELLVLDTLPGSNAYSLIFLDPSEGRETRTITPACQTDLASAATIDPDSGLLVDETAGSLYLVYDSYPGCIQRLDLASGQIVWQAISDEWFTFSAYGFYGLLGGDFLYFQQGNTLLAVERDSGKLRAWLAEADYEFTPLAVSGETLIVRARRTRGTERFELRGVDAASGASRWQMDLGESRPLDPPNEMSGLVDESDTAWTWRLVPAGLALARFEAGPHQVVITVLDPATGARLGETAVPLGRVSGDFYSITGIIGWQDSSFYVSIDGRIHAIDVNAGEVLFVR